MKLLVTGGAGYIGSVVTHKLVNAGHEVVVLDDLSTGYRENVPAQAEFHQLSIHQVSQLLTPGSGFDGVLHFAAKIEVAESVRYPGRFWETNIKGTLALLEAIATAGVKRLIFSSTGSMYRGVGLEKLTEEAMIRPNNPYAATKLAVDLMIAGECGASSLGAASLRYFNAAGAVDRLGERHQPESHLIPIALQAAAGEREKFLLYGDDYPTPDGTCIRDYIHIADLADAHLLALAAVQPGVHEIYNLGNGNGYSNKQVIETVREVTGRKFPIIMAPRRAGDPAACVASSEKARRELGWVPKRPALRDIIADAWEFQQRKILA
ncbi:MAG: UDP-glucose 4-epimerase GalE [Candidatus Dormibacteraceae bacterium]